MASPYWKRKVPVVFGDPEGEGALDGDVWGIFWTDTEKGKKPTIHIKPHLRQRAHRYDLWETLIHEIAHIVFPRPWNKDNTHHSPEFYLIVRRLTRFLYTNPHFLKILAIHKPLPDEGDCKCGMVGAEWKKD